MVMCMWSADKAQDRSRSWNNPHEITIKGRTLPIVFFNPNLNQFVLENEKNFGKDWWMFSRKMIMDVWLGNLELLLIDEP